MGNLAFPVLNLQNNFAYFSGKFSKYFSIEIISVV
jgi:hypothetical protein